MQSDSQHADLQCRKLYLTSPISIVFKMLIAIEIIAIASESIIFTLDIMNRREALSPWLAHVKVTRAKLMPGTPYREVLQIASKRYEKKSKTVARGRPKRKVISDEEIYVRVKPAVPPQSANVRELGGRLAALAYAKSKGLKYATEVGRRRVAEMGVKMAP